MKAHDNQLPHATRRLIRRQLRMLRLLIVALIVLVTVMGESHGEEEQSAKDSILRIQSSTDSRSLSKETTFSNHEKAYYATNGADVDENSLSLKSGSSHDFPPIIIPNDSMGTDPGVTLDTVDERNVATHEPTNNVWKEGGDENLHHVETYDGLEESSRRQSLMRELSSFKAVRRIFGRSISKVFNRKAQRQSTSTPTTASPKAQAPVATTYRSESSSASGSSSPSPPPFQGFHSGGGFNSGGGGPGSPFSNFSSGNYTAHRGGGGGGYHDGGGGGGGGGGFDGWNYTAPNKQGAPKFGCTDDFFKGSSSDCNSTVSGGGGNVFDTSGQSSPRNDTHPASSNAASPRNDTHPETSNVTPTSGFPIAMNDIELGVSVLVPSSVATMNLLNQVIMVVNDVLNENTAFHALGNPNIHPSPAVLRKNNVWLVTDPTYSNFTLVSSFSSKTVWQRYALGYLCFRSHIPIEDESTLLRIFTICQDAIDSSVSSGIFVRALRRESKIIVADIEGVAIYGEEDADQVSFPTKLSTTGWDVRRLVGLSMLCSTLLWALVLMHLGERRDQKLKKEEMWGIPLGTEQDVGKLLNLGFIWQQGEGHDGPPKGVVVFNKQRVGYRDDDSMLMGGFQAPHEVVDTTLPSSATS